jgi:hypothetical protein
MSSARRTRQQATGATKCPHCEKSLTDGRPTTQIDGQDYPWRMSSSGKAYRSITPVAVKITWHTACLDEFRAQNEAYRRQTRVDQLAGTYAFVIDDAVPHDQWLSLIDREVYSGAEITDAIAQAGGQQ